jgi:glycosyltransferase involved in cell wall biosynthesis
VRILILSSYFPQPRHPQLGTWALLQAQALARQGHQVTVFSPVTWVPRALVRLPFKRGILRRAQVWARCPRFHDWNGLPVHYRRWAVPHAGPQRRWTFKHPLPEALVGWWSVRRALIRIVEAERPQVIYAHKTPECGDLARRLKQRFGIPYVTVDHDFREVAACARFPARRAQYRSVAADAFASLADCRRLEDDIQRLIKPRRTLTLNTAADPPPSEMLEHDGATDDRVVVFSAGIFVHRKGFPLLIDAFARATADEDVVLRIVGDGPERAAVEQAIRRNRIEHRVELLGLLPYKAYLHELAKSDFFALVGWEEPCATVYMDAMAYGKPIVCASDGGINDVLESGVQGLTVKPRDIDSAAAAIRRLVSNAEERRRMGGQAQALHGRRLTWDANARALGDVFTAAAAARQ